MTIHINTDYGRLSPYGLMILLSFAVGLVLIWQLNRSGGVRKAIAGYYTLLAPMMSIFVGFFQTWAATLGKERGLSSIGGLVGMYAAALTLSLIGGDRKEGKVMFRSCTLVLPLIYGISKAGCLLAGCCHGIAYEGAFCVEYTGKMTGDICVFPVQLAESVVFMGIFAVGMVLYRKGSQRAVGVVLAASLLAKTGLDFLREAHVGKLITLNQTLCLIIAAAIICILMMRKNAYTIDKRAEM